ncbi:uncharacterized protein [Onthophagus taurus]|uniref:uncharacterized protein n=1 Tax=Onthophagus taurus TaxID=166361 RepID=UPI0039BE0A29
MSLVDEPAQLVKNLSITNDNFDRAWKLLVHRYENLLILVDTQVARLFNTKNIKNESASELSRLIAEIEEALAALESLGCDIKHWDPLLVYLVVKKLDQDSIKDWEKSVGDHRNPSKYSELLEFLSSRVLTLEAIEKNFSKKPTNINIGLKNSKNFHVKSHNASPYTSRCALCNNPHYLSRCQNFLSKNPKQRSEFVIGKKLCYNCLGFHSITTCKSEKRCRICQDQHHTVLHELPPEKLNKPSTVISKPLATNTSNLPSTSHTVHSLHINTPVLLATALIQVLSLHDESFTVRALIDQRSEVSFISESLAQQLHLPRRAACVPINGVGSKRTCTSNGLVSIKLVSQLNPSISFLEETLVLPKLTTYLPTRLSNNLPVQVKNLPLADPDFECDKRIDLILGLTEL